MRNKCNFFKFRKFDIFRFFGESEKNKKKISIYQSIMLILMEKNMEIKEIIRKKKLLEIFKFRYFLSWKIVLQDSKILRFIKIKEEKKTSLEFSITMKVEVKQLFSETKKVVV